MGMIRALQNNLPRTFEIQPAPESALVVQYHAACTLTINAHDQLLISLSAINVTIDLADHTLETLSNTLAELGFSVIQQNAAFLAYDARILIAQDGQYAGGDHIALQAFTNPLWSIIKPLAAALEEADGHRLAFLTQLNLPDAAAFWADTWGDYFGVPRRINEVDAHYTQRIIAEVFKARNTTIAIEQGIRESLDVQITIIEPWRRMFKLSGSRLSGRDALPGSYYQYHILHPISDDDVDWPIALAEIDRLRPAGSVIVFPRNEHSGIDFTVPDQLAVIGDHGHLHSAAVFMRGGILSSTLILSNNENAAISLAGEYSRMHSVALVCFVPDGDPTWGVSAWDTRTWYSASQFVSGELTADRHHSSMP